MAPGEEVDRTSAALSFAWLLIEAEHVLPGQHSYMKPGLVEDRYFA